MKGIIFILALVTIAAANQQGVCAHFSDHNFDGRHFDDRQGDIDDFSTFKRLQASRYERLLRCLHRTADGLFVTPELLANRKKWKQLKVQSGVGQSVIITRTGSDEYQVIWYGKWPMRVAVYKLKFTRKVIMKERRKHADKKVVFLLVNKVKSTKVLKWFWN